jgi:nucleoside-diphosphate-sugar epimerase
MAAENSTICVTGGGGFIGVHLVAHLTARPDCRVRVLTRRGDAVLPAAATVVQGDLRDVDAARGFAARGATVVNLAYAGDAHPDVNLAMADNLAAACIEAGVARLVHCSTAVVVGRCARHTIVESTACSPAPGYQRTKLEVERRLQARLHGKCPLTILRPTAVFGRGGANLCSAIDALRREPWLLGALKYNLLADRRTHLVCVENVVAAIEFVIDRRLGPELFIVSDDHANDNDHRHVTGILADELGMRRFPTLALPFRNALAAVALRLAGRVDADPRRIYSDRKLRDRGFSPPCELAECIRRFARWYAHAA